MARPQHETEMVELLREKYAELVRLRSLHGRENEPDPRKDMAALARKFPGALRELDDVPIEALKGRLAVLDEARGTTAPLPLWVAATHRFHALLRGALLAKGWLARRNAGERNTPQDGAAFKGFARGELGDGDASLWATKLEQVAAPPAGRLMPIVVGLLQQELGLEEAEARHLVFAHQRRGAAKKCTPQACDE